MSEKEVNEAILTLDVLIDCCKEDGTTYTAKKEWDALEVFKKLQQENTQLKQQIDKANNELITLIQIIMEQPSKNVEEDNYLLSRLESISNILVGGNND